MSGKCEHGLTTAECFTCASPKHGARPEPAQPDPTTDSQIDDLAHELWAIAQSPAPIDDVVALMRDELHKFARGIA